MLNKHVANAIINMFAGMNITLDNSEVQNMWIKIKKSNNYQSIANKAERSFGDNLVRLGEKIKLTYSNKEEYEKFVNGQAMLKCKNPILVEQLFEQFQDRYFY